MTNSPTPMMPVASHGRERLGWIDAARGGAILLLLFFHSAAVPEFRWGVPPPDGTQDFSLLVTAFRMPLLFFASGLLLHRSLSKPLPRFLTGKLRSLAWPYLVWVVVLLNTAGFAYFLEYYAFEPATWVSTGYLWFIFYLFFFYMAARLLAWLPPWAICLAMLVALVFWPDDLPRRAVAIYGFFFFAGHAAHPFLLRAVATTARPSLPRALTIVVSFALVIGVVVATSQSNGSVVVEFPGILLSLAGVVACLILIREIGDHRLFAPLRAIGRNSIVFYLTHWPVMIAAMTFFAATLQELDPWACTAGLFAASLLLGAALTWLRKFAAVDALFVFPSLSRRSRGRRANHSKAERSTSLRGSN